MALTAPHTGRRRRQPDELLVFDVTEPWDAPLSWVPGELPRASALNADRIAELLGESLHEYSNEDLWPWSGMSDAKHLLLTSPETDRLRAGFVRIRVYAGLADDAPAERTIVALDPVSEWPDAIDVATVISRLFATLNAAFDPEVAWAGPGDVLRSQGFPLYQDDDETFDEDAVRRIGLTVGWRTYFSARSGIDTSTITALPRISTEQSGHGLTVITGGNPANPDGRLIHRIRASIPGWS